MKDGGDVARGLRAVVRFVALLVITDGEGCGGGERGQYAVHRVAVVFGSSQRRDECAVSRRAEDLRFVRR